METIGKNLLLNTSGKTKSQVKLPNVFESDLLKTNKEIALQSRGVYRCLFGGGKFGKFASLPVSFKALFLAVSVDIGLLAFIKTLKNPMERSVKGVCALIIIIIMIIIIIILILIIIMDW